MSPQKFNKKEQISSAYFIILHERMGESQAWEFYVLDRRNSKYKHFWAKNVLENKGVYGHSLMNK